jgi:NAD+ diphosphatase
MVEMPFQWSPIHVSGYTPPDPAPARALWFVLRGTDLLVTQGTEGRAELPPIGHPHDLGIEGVRDQYLGLLGETHCYVMEATRDAPEPEGWGFVNLRTLYGAIDEDVIAVAGRAAQLVEWERTHQFCGVCGTATRRRATERARECPACGYIAYPKVTPAIMVLVRDGTRMLLARGPQFRGGMVSALAGFVEPGETLEQCVMREVGEEVGLKVKNIRYFASQPWPFPHQMMIAFFADYADGEISVDPVEIVEANWYEFNNLPRVPGKMSIAGRLIAAAVGEMQTSATH